MSLVNMKDMVAHAHRHNYAVAAFDMVNLEFVQGVMAAAESCRAPVILSLGESQIESLDFDLLVTAVECAAQRASVPVAIHYHHGHDLQSAVHAVNHGCNGVMVDSSRHELGQDIDITREVVAMARACGVAVEGLLGTVPEALDDGCQANPDRVVPTSAAEARGYVDRTGVDFLSISIGTLRGRMKSALKLDWQRLKQINDAVDVPLTIYGGTGLNNSQARRLIENGVAKVNYCSVLADAAFDQLRARTKGSAKGCYTDAVRSVREAVEEAAGRCLRMWGCAGRAAEVLEQCRHWLPVARTVTLDAQGFDDGSIEAALTEGQRLLRTIPGVREVCSGTAMRDDGLCRYSWLVRFCHPAAADSYRRHPAYLSIARHRFQSEPYAGLGANAVGRGPALRAASTAASARGHRQRQANAGDAK